MINYITAPFKWFFKLEAASGLILLLAAIVVSIVGIAFITVLIVTVVVLFSHVTISVVICIVY